MRGRFALLAATVVLAACADRPGEGDVPAVPELSQDRDYGVLPVLLTGRNLGALEAISAGTLMRQGSCLYLDTGLDPQLIVWGERVEIVEDGGNWAVRLPSGQLAREGDYIRGGGGGLPPGQPVADFTNEPVPDDCAVAAPVQVHSIEEVRPAERRVTPAGLPPPPPPPPPPPTLIESIETQGARGQGPSTEITGVSDPREALLVHMIQENESIGPDAPRPICLIHVDADMLSRLRRRSSSVQPAGACRWDDGLVVRRADNQPAALVEVKMKCDGRARCIAEGSRIAANMGGEGHGYVLEPVSRGWSVRKTGLSWIS